MSAEKKTIIVGRTGDGKSTFANKFFRYLGGSSDPFQESAGVESTNHYHSIYNQTIADQKIMDTPGLMDTNGIERDETNIGLIVQKLREEMYVNAILLVINEQAPRFDDGMQKAVQLIIDSFGPGCLQHMGIVFTKAFGTVSREDSILVARGITDLISRRSGHQISAIPSWQLDCHPRKLVLMGVPESHIASREEDARQSLNAISLWIRNKPAFQISKDMVAAKYEETTKLRAAQEEIARQQRENERKNKEYQEAQERLQRIVSTSKESRSEDTGNQQRREVDRKKARYRLGHRTTVWTNLFKEVRHLERSVQVRGNGEKIYGEWSEVSRSWVDIGQQIMTHQ